MLGLKCLLWGCTERIEKGSAPPGLRGKLGTKKKKIGTWKGGEESKRLAIILGWLKRTFVQDDQLYQWSSQQKN